MKTKIFFRVDGNTTIGRGHVSRSLAIADMLKNDFQISFITLHKNKEYLEKLIELFTIFTIELEDEILEIISKNDIVWLDGYHFKESYKKEVRNKVKSLIETNDIPYKANNVDILFNHTPGVKEKDFLTKDNSHIKLYLGLDYALLRQRFLIWARSKKDNKQGSGVFICFGGADTFNLAEKFVNHLLLNKFKDPIYWVTNIKNAAYQNTDNLNILSSLNEEEMIHYMLKAKVLLIPSSVLSFEAISLRKPIYTCFFVDNQKLIYKGLTERELVMGAGFLKTEKDVEKAISNFLLYYDDREKQNKLIDNQMYSIDGFSDNRIKDILTKINDKV